MATLCRIDGPNVQQHSLGLYQFLVPNYTFVTSRENFGFHLHENDKKIIFFKWFRNISHTHPYTQNELIHDACRFNDLPKGTIQFRILLILSKFSRFGLHMTKYNK